MISTKIIAAILAGSVLMYFVLRIAGYFAFRKLVGFEQQHILTSEQFKAKGKFE